MRSEKEMLGLILGFAEEHEAVRAVVMNGSRVDPGTKKDPFQDYDIVYLVTDTAGFTRRDDIPGHFGDPMIVQLPGEMTDPPPEGRDRYVYLMQFRDGTRVDLSIERVEEAKRILADSLSLVLLDKDGALGEVPPPGDRDYLTHPPREKAFSDCCNEFWWLNPYVAKALWRDQLPCAKHVMESFLRPQLVRMLCWDVAVSRGTPTAFGKHGARLKEHLGAPVWAVLERTYVDGKYDNMWVVLQDMGALFRSAGKRIGAKLNYPYPEREDTLVTEFIGKIRRLPADAREL